MNLNFKKGPGIVLSRVGGLSHVKQTHDYSPSNHGLWAFVFPYFEMFFIGSTTLGGSIKKGEQKSKYDSLKLRETKIRRFRWVGKIYVRINVPGSQPLNDIWNISDADIFREYIFTRYIPDLKNRYPNYFYHPERPLAPPRYLKDSFEVFLPKGEGKLIGKNLKSHRPKQ
ncbi:MAG: hypothetical protein E6Q89_00665 [Bacteroidia bacterium]|nr:MAG: hypothetical protein E6Q89_00665 [Bacteroidia bacterium]